jgi:hypothetical protein
MTAQKDFSPGRITVRPARRPCDAYFYKFNARAQRAEKPLVLGGWPGYLHWASQARHRHLWLILMVRSLYRVVGRPTCSRVWTGG